MIQLFLDDMPAVPGDNSSIKLVLENPYFSKSGSYSYDIELPLNIPANRAIFGFINRLDITKKERLFAARLIIDNKEVLSGTAHITSINESSVRLQLLGGPSAYNHRNKMDNLFIDKLDLGDWYMTTWPDGSYYTDNRFGEVEKKYYPAGTRFRGSTANMLRRMGYDSQPDYPWVAFPALNSAADVFCNGFYYQFKDSSRAEVVRRDYMTRAGGTPVLCVQPYLWIMAQKIARATGFELDNEDNDLYNDELFRKIFIVNSTNNIDCAKCLPHWSVNDWWTNIEDTFGLVFSVDYSSRKATLMKRARHYSEDDRLTELSNVVEQFSAELEDETQSDISLSNVGFAEFENDAAERLSDYIHEFAVINREFQDIEQLSAWANEQGDAVMANYKDVIFECADGRRFIYMQHVGLFPALVEVDMFRSRIAKDESEEIDIELKFVPAKFVDYITQLYDANRNGSGASGSHGLGDKLTDIDISVIEVPGDANMAWCNSDVDSEKIDIEAILNEEEEENRGENNLPDVIYIAINNGYENKNATTSFSLKPTVKLLYSRPVLREKYAYIIGVGKPFAEDSPYSLSLVPVMGQINLASQTVLGLTKIDTAVRICVRFISRDIPDVGSLFLIRNKRYICEKLEATFSENKLDRLITGYFFETQL